MRVSFSNQSVTCAATSPSAYTPVQAIARRPSPTYWRWSLLRGTCCCVWGSRCSFDALTGFLYEFVGLRAPPDYASAFSIAKVSRPNSWPRTQRTIAAATTILSSIGKLTVKAHVCPTSRGTSPESFHPLSEKVPDRPLSLEQTSLVCDGAVHGEALVEAKRERAWGLTGREAYCRRGTSKPQGGWAGKYWQLIHGRSISPQMDGAMT